jgi:2-polyprenyl-3-methyl-5-hydroxy-6-metoxy-1,4-benzoquinol methylase
MNDAERSHEGPNIDQVGDYVVIDCVRCGFRHVTPLPDHDEIARWYREHHYSDAARDRIDYYERDRDWWLLAFSDIFAEIATLKRTSGHRMIDVGCGTGMFLEVSREQGWQGLGFEPSSAAAEHCRRKGLEILEEEFSPHAIDAEPAVDVVHMRNVLEHVIDPSQLVKTAHSMLDDDGLLIASVPNDYNPLQLALRDADGYSPWWLAPPHHLNYFSFETLEALLARCGFELAGRFCTFPIDLFLTMGDNYVNDGELGRICHLKRVRFEKVMEAASQSEARRNLYRAIAAAGFGREAIVIARRVAE